MTKVKSLEINESIVKKMLGNDFYNMSLKDKLIIDDCINANDILAEYLYGKKIADLLKKDDTEGIKKIVKETKEKFEKRRLSVESSNYENLAMIVIRPENIDIVEKYIEYLKNKGLELIYRKSTNISFEQYLLMYHHGLIPKESRFDFPTRTLNYIDKECIILMFKNNNKEINIPLSDYLTKIKGKQGKYTKDSLRGDIAYNHLKNYVDETGKKFNKDIYNIYFDPIGMCRLLTRNQIESDRAHEIANLPLLFYTGQAVHVPDSKELKDDLSVLLDLNEIDKVEEKIKKKI